MDEIKASGKPPAGQPERSGGSPAGGFEPDPEVSERPRRRRFTAEYKAHIVRKAEFCKEPGALGALLRGEGLYFSHLSTWRKQARSLGLNELGRRKRGPAPKPKASAREIQLEREIRKLEKQVARRDAIIAFQKKVHELLGIPLKSQELEDGE